MARVSSQHSPKTTAVVKVLPAATNTEYVASRDHGTRRAEMDKHFVQFGRRKATIYKRSDVSNSSWYFRFFVCSEVYRVLDSRFSMSFAPSASTPQPCNVSHFHRRPLSRFR
jgi:hypothetical protein